MKTKKQTQKEFVYEVLKNDGFITRNYCLRNYITRLSSIIDLFKKEGFTFKCEYIKVETFWGEGKDYKYTCVELTKALENARNANRVQGSLF